MWTTQPPRLPGQYTWRRRPDVSPVDVLVISARQATPHFPTDLDALLFGVDEPIPVSSMHGEWWDDRNSEARDG